VQDHDHDPLVILKNKICMQNNANPLFWSKVQTDNAIMKLHSGYVCGRNDSKGRKQGFIGYGTGTTGNWWIIGYS
jgi:hypothetical protein